MGETPVMSVSPRSLARAAERPANPLGPVAQAGWDYASAPESLRPDLQARYQLFIEGKWSAPKSGEYFPSINPATEEPLAEVALAGASDIDRAVKAARKAFEKTWRPMPGRERGKYLFRIARMIQEKARELAVLETMDGGKPIRESRDVDLPLVAAHFFYHAGWADKLNYAFPGRKPRPLGVVRADHPMEFPAAHGGVENRARARLRQYRRPQARRNDAAHRDAPGANLPGRRTA